MPASHGLSDSQWKKIYEFYSSIPYGFDDKVGGVTFVSNHGRDIYYTYRELLLCLCTDDCKKYGDDVVLARFHKLNHIMGETVTVTTAAVLHHVNCAYKAYRPYMPHYIVIKTGNTIHIHR